MQAGVITSNLPRAFENTWCLDAAACEDKSRHFRCRGSLGETARTLIDSVLGTHKLLLHEPGALAIEGTSKSRITGGPLRGQP